MGLIFGNNKLFFIVVSVRSLKLPFSHRAIHTQWHPLYHILRLVMHCKMRWSDSAVLNGYIFTDVTVKGNLSPFGTSFASLSVQAVFPACTRLDATYIVNLSACRFLHRSADSSILSLITKIFPYQFFLSPQAGGGTPGPVKRTLRCGLDCGNPPVYAGRFILR